MERDARHTEVDRTYDNVTDEQGMSSLRVDTYRSTSRQIRGKKSQPIRFAPDAIKRLKTLLA